MTQNRVLLPHFLEGSQYIQDVGRAYQELGWHVVYGRDNLFELSIVPELVHLHWPESIYRWATVGSIELRAKKFVESLKSLKRMGVKIVWTVQNLTPHESSDNDLDLWVYQQVIDLSDIIVHHCKNSIELLSSKYKVDHKKNQLVVPRGGFSSMPNEISKLEARLILGLHPTSFIFLHFGYIRPYKGLFLLIKAFFKINVPHKILLVAGPYHAVSSRVPRFDLLILRLISVVYPKIRLHLEWIEDSQVQNFMNASDCVVMSHFSGLNSGVASLGMTFGKLMIGPNVGCLSEVLESGPNLSFEARNLDELIRCLEQAPLCNLSDVAEKNKAVSEEWSWLRGIQKILNAALS